MLAEAVPRMSGWPPGGVAVPPKMTGICAAYPGSVLFAADTTGLIEPHQLLLKFLTLAPGAGSEPPVWWLTT